MQIIERNGEHLVGTCDVFEYAITHSNKFSIEEQRELADALSGLSWIDKRIDDGFANLLIQSTAGAINDHSVPVCIMTFSAIIYKCRERGYDVKPMVDAIIANESWLVSECGNNNDDYLTLLN